MPLALGLGESELPKAKQGEEARSSFRGWGARVGRGATLRRVMENGSSEMVSENSRSEAGGGGGAEAPGRF